jgi:tetratricopeptide (TPR) repeat protein
LQRPLRDAQRARGLAVGEPEHVDGGDRLAQLRRRLVDRGVGDPHVDGECARVAPTVDDPVQRVTPGRRRARRAGAGLREGLHKAIQAYAEGDIKGAATLFREASEKDSRERVLANDVLAGLLSAQGPSVPGAELCDLYAEAGARVEIVDVAAGNTNQDDVTLKVRLYQAQALLEQGVREAAMEAYPDALRSKKRSPDLLKEARYQRALLYLESGKRAHARKAGEDLRRRPVVPRRPSAPRPSPAP